MKSFIIFATIIAVVSSNAIGRSGWGQPNPAVSLLTDGALAAAGSGASHGSQAIQEAALGGHASILSANGLTAETSQDGLISQVQTGTIHGETNTAQVVSAENVVAAVDFAVAAEDADGQVIFADSANTDAEGEGAVAVVGATSNLVQNRKH